MTTFTDFIATTRTANTKKGVLKVPMAADMAGRWASRILPRKLHEQGVRGAMLYLADYGNGIAAPKCVALALKAESEACPALAVGFWRKAFELTTSGQVAEAALNAALSALGAGAPNGPVAPAPAPAHLQPASPAASPFPAHLQPGHLVTMQPIDAPNDPAHYIVSIYHWGQPKRDGQHLVAYAADDLVGQKRSTTVIPLPDEIAAPLRALRQTLGDFILDGELVYFDAAGGEHRTGAQAATANIKLGRGEVLPLVRYCIFKALFADGRDLTARGVEERERISAGQSIGQHLAGNPHFELLPTAKTEKEKAALLARQKAEGREGVIFVDQRCEWQGGKATGWQAPYVRVKFLRTLDVVVTGLTPTTVAGRSFASIEVAAYVDGKLTPLGAVGTGFTAAQAAELRRRHQAAPGQIVIEIDCLGLTENGQVFQARLKGDDLAFIRDDKRPEECVLF